MKWKIYIKDIDGGERSEVVEAPTMEAAMEAASKKTDVTEYVSFGHAAGQCPYDGRACDSYPNCGTCCIASYYQQPWIP